jgi:hypothetical protein
MYRALKGMLGLAAGVAVLASAPAFAVDGKVYTSQFCQGSLVGNPPIISYTGKSVRNNSTTNSAVLSCPIVKDEVNSLTGSSYSYVRYCKASTTGFLSTLYSYSAAGTSVYQNSKSDFGAAGCKYMYHDPISSYSSGFYNLILVLPPSTAAAQKTEVIAYRFDEN